MVNYEVEEGQIVLCIVEKILGTTVFVKIEGNGEGTITTSEIAPGRIRNLRDYVVPGKRIVCKVLKVTPKGAYLSLRRVKQNEKKEVLERKNRENNYKAILKSVLKEEAEKTIEKIENDYSITDFFESLKNNPKLIENYLSKKDSEKIIKIIESKKEKLKQIKHIFRLSSKSSEGINKIKNIINSSCESSKCIVSYIAAGRYAVLITGEDFKSIKTEIAKVLEKIESLAKKQNCEYSLEKS